MSSSTVRTVLTNAAAWDFAIQGGGFLLSTLLKTEKFYDLTGSGTFLFLTYKSFKDWGPGSSLRQKILSGCVGVWAARLGYYLFSRVMHSGEDRRFREAKKSPPLLFVFWMVQGVWVLSTLAPVLIVNAKKVTSPLQWRDYLGMGMWAAGFLIEVIADRQKSVFRSNPENAGKFIQNGLWSLSRHPNYFGEILMWSGIFLSASSVMKKWEYCSAASPIVLAFLLTKISGVPILEKYGLKKWGQDPAYLEYLSKTPVLVPSLARIKDLLF